MFHRKERERQEKESLKQLRSQRDKEKKREKTLRKLRDRFDLDPKVHLINKYSVSYRYNTTVGILRIPMTHSKLSGPVLESLWPKASSI